MDKVKLQLYSDGAHGWLRVPVDMIKALDIVKNITIFSYLKGRYAYLEEDIDARTFIDAAKSRGIEVIVNSRRESNGPSQIRRYPPYKVS